MTIQHNRVNKLEFKDGALTLLDIFLAPNLACASLKSMVLMLEVPTLPKGLEGRSLKELIGRWVEEGEQAVVVLMDGCAAEVGCCCSSGGRFHVERREFFS